MTAGAQQGDSAHAADIANATPVAYRELQQAYDHFNVELFDGKLPGCLITLQREKKSHGYFSFQRFASAEGLRCDEIALNPMYFAIVPLEGNMQTLVHEMAHQWQAHFGDRGRARYHNAEWGQKMEAIGLMPSSTGKPGGKRTGDHVADYPIKGGRFEIAARKLIDSAFRISWFDRFVGTAQLQVAAHLYGGEGAADGVSQQPTEQGGPNAHAAYLVEQLAQNNTPMAASAVRDSMLVTPASPPALNKSNRVKYVCPHRHQNAWAKADSRFACMDCGCQMLPSQPKRAPVVSHPVRERARPASPVATNPNSASSSMGIPPWDDNPFSSTFGKEHSPDDQDTDAAFHLFAASVNTTQADLRPAMKQTSKPKAQSGSAQERQEPDPEPGKPTP